VVSRKKPPAYVPERGDVVWITLDPQAGHEQAGRRPALVLSPATYNGLVGLGLFCSITSRAKGYPFEVPLPGGLAVSGVVLADMVKSLDWRARQAERAGVVPGDVVGRVLERLCALLAQEA
jgi:mRNA interferase MazF